tara:strand:- start:1164 stop:2336 length:1173 start_codon:yes stop_codon:yes gene_type:complete
MNSTPAADKALDQQDLLDEAKRRAGSSDFGPDWFLDPMAVVLKSIREDARLSEMGIIIQRETILNGLVNRLRMFEAIKNHPEILDEEVNVAGIVLGLPRTGSTMLHRLLATSAGMTGVRWWETQNFSPFPDEERGNPEPRREAAKQILTAMLESVPDLTAIHPFSIDGPDEEVIILGQFFISTMAPSTLYVPSYSAWLVTADQRPGYEDLKTVLKFLQWQDITRKGKRWILKAPTHVTAPGAALKVFPEAKLIMTHRDPLQTIPSFCSMVTSLYKLTSDDVNPTEAAAYTSSSWAGHLNRLAEYRKTADPERFIDVRYEDQLADPHSVVHHVLERLGVPQSDEIDAHISEWLEENAREKRAAHKYSMADFGLTEEQIKNDFASYSAQFLS